MVFLTLLGMGGGGGGLSYHAIHTHPHHEGTHSTGSCFSEVDISVLIKKNCI